MATSSTCHSQAACESCVADCEPRTEAAVHEHAACARCSWKVAATVPRASEACAHARTASARAQATPLSSRSQFKPKAMSVMCPPSSNSGRSSHHSNRSNHACSSNPRQCLSRDPATPIPWTRATRCLVRRHRSAQTPSCRCTCPTPAAAEVARRETPFRWVLRQPGQQPV